MAFYFLFSKMTGSVTECEESATIYSSVDYSNCPPEALNVSTICAASCDTILNNGTWSKSDTNGGTYGGCGSTFDSAYGSIYAMFIQLDAQFTTLIANNITNLLEKGCLDFNAMRANLSACITLTQTLYSNSLTRGVNCQGGYRVSTETFYAKTMLSRTLNSRSTFEAYQVVLVTLPLVLCALALLVIQKSHPEKWNMQYNSLRAPSDHQKGIPSLLFIKAKKEDLSRSDVAMRTVESSSPSK